MGNLLYHLFLPHHSNNHRPKVLQIDALLVYVLLFLLFNLAVRSLHRSYPEVLGFATDINVEVLLVDTNAKRQAAGLPPLSLNTRLSAAAAKKAQDMFAHNYWAHTSPQGRTPWDFVLGEGYKYSLAGENLAKNFSDSRGVVEAWMASLTHRENILKSSYQDIGFAVVNGVLNGEETTLVVQMFGTSSVPVAALPPVVPAVPETAATTPGSEVAPARGVASAFAAVSKRPIFNLATMTRDVVFVFVGILMGVLAVDAWLVSQRRTVRLVGHNVAHILFLAAFLIATSAIQRGSLL